MSQTTCALCGKSVPFIRGYIPWCECGWNLELPDYQIPRSLTGKIYKSFGKRRGKAIFENLLNNRKIPREARFTTAILVLFSAAVQLFTISILALGIYFIYKSYSNLFLIFPGLGLLGLAWIGRPRFGKIPTDALSPVEFPELHRTVSRVAQALNTSPPDYIIVDEQFNAAVSYVGLFRRKALFIGLPLFLILNGQEKIALISHELSHFVNRDPSRILFLSMTARTLEEWHRILYPEQFLPKNGDAGIIMMLSELVSNIFLYMLSWIPYILLQVFVHLAWDRSQIAEYLADRLGAKISGTTAFVGMSEKTLLEPKISIAIQRVALKNDGSGAIGEIQAEARNIHQREFERIRKQAELEEIRLDATHPPTAFRIKLLRAYEFIEPTLNLNREDEGVLNKELSPLADSLNRKLVDRYLQNIYYGR